ncbi:uncharacterized protein [Linepithema humile]|uniref:uncharacterized protein n=1 Tax=Linepithema humile TaxID=83485 RepID=UPI00062358E7|nr:PREDICTED: uncharacterized protein LOC105679658 [Linepithema humile]
MLCKWHRGGKCSSRGLATPSALFACNPESRTRWCVLCDMAEMKEHDRTTLCFLLIFALCTRVYSTDARHIITKRNYSDQSVRGYLAERTCWWNEVCKEEFHSKFRCRCPRWSYCRAPGRYYDAHCSMTRTGYIWTQPETSLSLEIDK